MLKTPFLSYILFFVKKVVFMSKKSIFSVFVLSAALFSTSAFAQGMYIAGSAGMGIAGSSVKTDTDALLVALGVANLKSSVTDGTAMEGTLGYAFNPNFAAEVGYFNSGTLSYSGTGTGKTLKSDIKVTGIRLAAVGIAPITDQFSIYGKLGYGILTTDNTGTVNTTAFSSSEKKNIVGYGVGVMYKLVDNISLKASYEMIASDVSAFLVGVQIMF
jgi:OOP family OmpA-OmpF porin